ncbi:hypothetical protein FFLO_02755 [Filobasidium floriforme]|uniref:Methyltransferase type 11 domain-containing protein n=1 Tax=Filobasidium floriforme TaxID=5210 RepID=A0A8K0NQX6_9TREE|nr:hypothetical protein FFLO_02755 [Filobasidium floriforme]
MVHHIDENAVAELNNFYGDVLPAPVVAPAGTEKTTPTVLPKILDLASSWVSHIPLKDKGGAIFPRNRVVGVGLNAQELKANPILSHYKVLDLDVQPDIKQALSDGTEKGEAFQAVSQMMGEQAANPEPLFDAVICNVSIDYLTRPLDVLYHTANVIKPGGWVYLAISNRCFPTKVVRPWLNLSEHERLDLVASYFHFAGTAYSPSPPLPKTTVMKQPARPDDSGYSGVQPGGLYEQIESIEVVSRESRSDPLWVVRAKRRSD